MSTTIRLKHSSSLSGGVAKEPSPADLANGELALNINKDDPAVFLKDSAGNVIRMTGGKAGSIDVGATPPTDPKPGNLWWNEADNTLYIYTVDVDGTEQWVISVPQGAVDYTRVVVKDNPAPQNLIGDLTLGPDGSPVTITLSEDTGNATFTGKVTTDSTVASDPGETVVTKDYADQLITDIGIGDYVSKTDTASQNIESDLTLNTDKITLDATDGTAEFAGSITLRTPVVDVNNTPAFIDPVKDTGGNVQGRSIFSSHRIRTGSAYSYAYTGFESVDNIGYWTLWGSRTDDTAITDGAKIQFGFDGNASFAESAAFGGWDGYGSGTDVAGVIVNGNGNIGIRNPTTNSGTSGFLRCWDGITEVFRVQKNSQLRLGGDVRTDTNSNILLTGSDGSAEFTGEVAVNGSHGSGAKLRPDGPSRFITQKESTTDLTQDSVVNIAMLLADRGVAFAGSNNANATSSAPNNWKSIIYANGEAWFKSDVTSDGTIGFNLEPDNDANYVTTTDVDEEGNPVETRVYNGPTLDVKEELQKLIARAQQQDAYIKQLTAVVADLGGDVSTLPAPPAE